jgi:hypothetical protein
MQRHQPGPQPLDRRSQPAVQRFSGIALIEVLIALVVLSVGLASLARLQLWLWTSVDASRQQGEASRLAQQDLEGLHGWLTLTAGAGRDSYAAIAGQAASAVTGPGGNTVYELERRVLDGPLDAALPRYKLVRSGLRWIDREGTRRELALPGLIAGLDPYWSAALLLTPGNPAAGSATALPAARHPGIPPDASLLADGRLVWKVERSADLAWLFDRSSGRVSQRCSGTAGLASAELGAGSLGSCVALSGLVVWGTVRFATTVLVPGSAEAADPPSPALDLDLLVTLSSSGHPSPAWSCEDNSASAVASAVAPGAVRYLCLVQPAGVPPRWSGRVDLLPRGWLLGSSAPEALRVCRYSADQNGNGRIDNTEHPATYTDVDGPLGHQNFLVIPMAASCPQDSPGAPGPLLADFSTQPHQP